jgi:hypothetical protein
VAKIVEPKVRKTGPLPCSLERKPKSIRRKRDDALALVAQGMQNGNDRLRNGNASIMACLGFRNEPLPPFKIDVNPGDRTNRVSTPTCANSSMRRI